MDEDRGYHGFLSRQAMQGYAFGAPYRPDQSAWQQGDPQAGGDAAEDCLQRAEFHQSWDGDAAFGEEGFEALAIGAA